MRIIIRNPVRQNLVNWPIIFPLTIDYAGLHTTFFALVLLMAINITSLLRSCTPVVCTVSRYIYRILTADTAEKSGHRPAGVISCADTYGIYMGPSRSPFPTSIRGVLGWIVTSSSSSLSALESRLAPSRAFAFGGGRISLRRSLCPPFQFPRLHCSPRLQHPTPCPCAAQPAIALVGMSRPV